jgi:hypothetical protein
LTHLPAPDLLPSNSVREAVRRIRVKLEQLRANASVRPAKVAIDQSANVEEIIKQIANQTGNPIDYSGLPTETLSRNLDWPRAEMSFWQAIGELSNRLDLANETEVPFKRLKLTPFFGPRRPPLAAIGNSGVFRLEVATSKKIPRPRTPAVRKFEQQHDLLRLQLRVRPEPRLRPLFLQFASKEVQFQLGDSASLQPLSTEANYDLPFADGAIPATFQLDYVLPNDQDLRRPGKLIGKMRCTLAAGHELFRFPKVAEAVDAGRGGVSRRRGGVTVSLTRVAIEERTLRVRISVVYDVGGPAFESHRTWFLNNDVYLEGPDGRQISLNGGTDTVQQGDGTLGIEYTFANLPDPLPELTFVYSAPTLMIDVPLEFQIESVPVDSRPAAEMLIK